MMFLPRILLHFHQLSRILVITTNLTLTGMDLDENSSNIFGGDFDPLDYLHILQSGEIQTAAGSLGNLEESGAMLGGEQPTTPFDNTVNPLAASAAPVTAENGSPDYQEFSDSSQGSSVWGDIQTGTEFDGPNFGFTSALPLAETALLADPGAPIDSPAHFELGSELEAMLEAAPAAASSDDAQTACVDPTSTALKPLNNNTDAVIVALGILGVGLGQDILDTIKAHSLNNKLSVKTWVQFNGPLCNVLNSDRITYCRRGDNVLKDPSTHNFVIEQVTVDGRSAKRVWLTPLGRATARTLVGLPSGVATPKFALSFSAAMQCILSEHSLLTCDDIVRIIREQHYCTFLQYWSNPNATGADPGELREAPLRGLIGRYMVRHFGTSDESGLATVCTFNGFYWLAKNGYGALIERLEQFNPYGLLGMKVFNELVISRIQARRAVNVSEDKLKRKTTDDYDSRMDCVPLLIPADSMANFFQERESSIAGAGLGLWLREGIDLPAHVFVTVDGTMRLGERDSAAWGSHTFSAEHPITGDFYTIDALQPDGSLACLAARMNDSRDGNQQFPVAESVALPDGSFVVCLRSVRKINGGEEVFFDYGPAYWAGAEGSQGPVHFPAPSSPCKKRNTTDSEPAEPFSKRQKDTSFLDLPPPLFINEGLPFDIDEF